MAYIILAVLILGEIVSIGISGNENVLKLNDEEDTLMLSQWQENRWKCDVTCNEKNTAYSYRIHPKIFYQFMNNFYNNKQW